MRIAAIYDIHANFPALEAVVQEIREADIDQIVIGGDVLPGPMPRETIDCLRKLELPVKYVMGNGDRNVLAVSRGGQIDPMPESAKEVLRWTAQQIQPEIEEWIGTWPKTLSLVTAEFGEVLFCHATPRNDTDIFTRLTPEESLLPFFEGDDASVVVCGHTHMQFDRMIGNVRVINAGSVGMPFQEPGAYWLLLDEGVKLRQTSYDLDRAAQIIRETHYPQAQEFADHNVLRPPSEEAMLQAFSKAKLN